MAESSNANVLFTNNTSQVLYPKIHYFWSGTPVTALPTLPSGSNGRAKHHPSSKGALKFAAVYVDTEEVLPTTRQFISAFDIAHLKNFGANVDAAEEKPPTGDEPRTQSLPGLNLFPHSIFELGHNIASSMLHTKPNSNPTSDAGVPQPQKCGPYGTQSPENYSLILGPDESIKEVIVKYGVIVDSIGFVVADKTGATSTKIFGGPKGNEAKITLKSDEHITHISGIYGKYSYSHEDNTIAALSIHTNLNPGGYGPYGNGTKVKNPQNFATPTGRVVGFFGRHDEYLHYVGVYLNAATSKVYVESGPIGPIDWNAIEVKLDQSAKSSVVYEDNITKSKVEGTVRSHADGVIVYSEISIN